MGPSSGASRHLLPQGEKGRAALHRPSPLAGEGGRRPDEGSRLIVAVSYRNGILAPSTRAIPLEAPVSLSFNGTSHAVMMATPADLQDFAIGFALTQRIVESLDEIDSIEIEEVEGGMDCRLWIAQQRAEALSSKRRAMAGPTGCGICGVEGIEDALQPVARVHSVFCPTPSMIMTAIASLAPAQTLGMETRAVHAAGFWTPEEGLIAIREDVGRHNALDKLAGALTLTPEPSAIRERGVILLTSRVSIEMVQKTAAIGASVIVAVSAPTLLAIETAEAANIMLIGIARTDGFEVFTFPERVREDVAQSAA
jgi:FdhD protein